MSHCRNTEMLLRKSTIRSYYRTAIREPLEVESQVSFTQFGVTIKFQSQFEDESNTL